MRVWKSWKGRRTKNGNRANGDKIAEREKINKRQIQQNNEIYILTIADKRNEQGGNESVEKLERTKN